MTRMEPEEARQGPKGKPVLKVLVAALALCAVAFIGMGIYGWSMPDNSLPHAADGQTGAAPSASPGAAVPAQGGPASPATGTP